jgi:hypothetical protein
MAITSIPSFYNLILDYSQGNCIEEAQQKAEEGRQRAIAAQAQADRFAARLRELGIDPEQV